MEMLRGGPAAGAPRGDVPTIVRTLKEAVEREPPDVLGTEQAMRALQARRFFTVSPSSR